MFTWNFQYISKSKLADTLKQLMLSTEKNDILIRIHTAIHNADEAVDLAQTIKSLVPGAYILGTSASAVICSGKLIYDQCIISVTQMDEGSVKSVMMPLEDKRGCDRDPDSLCADLNDSMVNRDTRLMLAFMTGGYLDAFHFVSDVTNILKKSR